MLPADAGRGLMLTFEAVEGERVANAMKNAILQRDLPSALNTTRRQVMQLLESRVLPTLTGKIGAVSDRGTAVGAEVVTKFLSDLRRNAELVQTAPEGMLGIPKAAQASRVTAAAIVQFLLDGRLSRVFQMSGVPGYGGILVDPHEARFTARADIVETAASPMIVQKRLRVSWGVVKALMAPREGGALLPSFPGNSRSGLLVSVEDIEAFSRTYVSLIGLSREIGMHHAALLRNLNAEGVEPIDDPEQLQARIYRRSEIPTRLTA